MSDEPQVISPRGIPPIRPDWLVDVAWRLLDLGLDHLRSWAEAGQYVLEDVVDGERWRFESVRLTSAFETRVEHEADLFLPTDTSSPTLRAAFAFTPWWDEERGRCVRARVEIGPRGPVTFDPENWIVLLPYPGTGGARPTITGVEAGSWEYGGDAPRPTEAVAHRVIVGQSLGVEDLDLLDEDDGNSIPELVLPVSVVEDRKGFLGRTKRVQADVPGHIALITADGPLRVNPHQGRLFQLVEAGWLEVADVEVFSDKLVIHGVGANVDITGAAITLRVLPSDAP